MFIKPLILLKVSAEMLSEMVSPIEFSDFRTFIRAVFKDRCEADPNYSLRKFSRDLQISPARLSEILNSNCGISMSAAVRICKSLELTAEQTMYFLDLVRSKYSRNASERNEAKKRLPQYPDKRTTRTIQNSESDLLSEWYYIPLIELLVLKTATPDESIQKILGLSAAKLQEAKMTLLKSGHLVIDENGRLQKSIPNVIVQSKTPSESVRRFHREVLKRAIEGVSQPIDRKKYLSTYFIIKSELLTEARDELAKLREAFLKKFSDEGGDKVYCFAIQLFDCETN